MDNKSQTTLPSLVIETIPSDEGIAYIFILFYWNYMYPFVQKP